MLKPVFMSKADRETMAEKDKLYQEEITQRDFEKASKE